MADRVGGFPVAANASIEQAELETVTPEFIALIQRAERGDETALPELHKALDGNGHFWRKFGDLGWHAEQVWLRLLTADNPLFKGCVERALAELKAELNAQSPLERLLVSRIAI